MNRKIKLTIALILSMVMILSLLSACRETEAEPEETPVVTADPGSVEATPKPPPGQTLVVGINKLSQQFSPFFARTDYDTQVSDIVHLKLLSNDREGNIVLRGINGEIHKYNGTDYTYYGPADVSIERQSNGSVDYNITLRSDMVHSDGTPLNIDDLIFTMYVLADPDYDGTQTFYSLPITGLNNYRTGVNDAIYTKYEMLGRAIANAGSDNDDFSEWTIAQQNAFWIDCYNTGGIRFTQDAIDYSLKLSNYISFLSDVKGDVVAYSMYIWGFGTVEGDVFTSAISRTRYDMAEGEFPTILDFWHEISAHFGLDLQAISNHFSAARQELEAYMVYAFITSQGPRDPMSGGEITNIAGIKRTGDFSMTVTTDYFAAITIYHLAQLPIAPLHYYGDVNLYNYNSDWFGIRKGDLSPVRAKDSTPLGAGPYQFVSYMDDMVTFKANPHYYRGQPLIANMLWKECDEADKPAGIVTGELDITNPVFSTAVVDAIKGYNENGNLSGDVIITNTVENLGYGYIGINARTVNVAGEPGSEESKNLRKALATLFAVYRDDVNNSFYGDRAVTIQYPISNTSWAAPRPTDPGYSIAYSVDIDGNQIYDPTMAAPEKYAAALNACIGYLKAAGYTWDDRMGEFTRAPQFSAMSFRVIVPPEGPSGHPAQSIFIAAKAALVSIGLDLEIYNPSESEVLWDSLRDGTCDIWAAAWQATIDPDMYQIYHSSNIAGIGGTGSNYYGIADEELDALIIGARLSENREYRKDAYKQCFDIIMQWAVEVPNYQRRNAILFSPQRINMDTVTPDITTFCNWTAGIESMEMITD